MEKKIYVKPEAEHIIFYSEEEIANMNILRDDNEGGILTPEFSSPEAEDGWM